MLELPARHPWEEPPTAGWASSLPGLGRELFLLATCAALTVGGYKIVLYARKMGEHPQHGLRFASLIAMWCFACIVLAALGVYVYSRLGGLGTLTAMLTDYGRLARLRGRPPVWLDAPP